FVGPSHFVGNKVPFPGASVHGGDGQLQTRFALAQRVFDLFAPGDVHHAADDALYTPLFVAHHPAPIPDPEVAPVLVAGAAFALEGAPLTPNLPPPPLIEPSR